MAESAWSLSGSQACTLLASWFSHLLLNPASGLDVGEKSSLLGVSMFFFFLSMELRWEPLETEGPILLEGQLYTMQWASQAHRSDKQFKSSAVEGNRVVWGLGGG